MRKKIGSYNIPAFNYFPEFLKYKPKSGWKTNNAYWWSHDLISEDEFEQSIIFLIEEGIIAIN